VHEKVGDLKIDDIEGEKDLGLSVGDIRVAFGHPCQPANCCASTFSMPVNR
jgi:hypothetical protein